MKIKTKVSIKELNGEDAKELTVGKAIANIVLFDTSDPLRSYIMATKFYSSESEVDISKSDQEWIKKTVTEFGHKVYGNSLVAGQLLVILSNLKEDKV